MTEPFLRVFCVIDSFIAKVVNSLFELLNTVIDYRFFGTDKIIGSVIEKVYVLFAIFLLFKTSVEIINFIISPDKLSSKDQGAASFVKRIIITLALMVSFPFIFDKAQELQKEVISNNVLEKIFFGTSGTSENATGILDNESYGFSKLLFEDLINYKSFDNDCIPMPSGEEGCTIISEVSACCRSIYNSTISSGYTVMTCLEEKVVDYKELYDTEGNWIGREAIKGMVCDVSLTLYCRQEIMGWYENKNYDKDENGKEIHTDGDHNEEITEAVKTAAGICHGHNSGYKLYKDKEVEDYYPGTRSEKYGNFYKSKIEDADYYLRKVDEAVDRNSVSEVLATGIFAEGDGVFSYKVGIPTVLGIFVIIFLAFFCIDCIYRSLRLMFFEMVAPLAIATYVDHRSATSGIFNKWVRQTVMAYIELFIKFISLYFIIFMVVNINEVKLIGSTKSLSLNDNPLLVIIIMAAIVYFAWYLPKFLKQSLGINVESNGSYSLFKQAKEKLMKFYKTTLKVLAAVGISVATGGAAAAAAGGGAVAGAAAGATTATAATTTATGTGAAAAAARTTGTAAAATGGATAAGATAAGANAAGASAASMAGANAVANTAAQGVNQGAQIAKQMARSGIRAGIDAIRNPDKSLFNIVSDATEWSSKLRNLDAHGIGFKERAVNQLNKTFQLDSGSMGAYDGLVNSLKEAEMKIKDISDNFEKLDNMINSTIANNSIPSNEFNEAFAGEHIIGDDGRYYIDMKYEDYDAFIAANPDSVITQEIYDQFRELIERKQELKNEEFMAEAEKEEWEELLEDLDDV